MSAAATGSGSEAAIDPEAFRGALGSFATGVTVVTAMEDAEPVGFTCQSFTSLSLDPPMVAIAPAKSSTSWPRMVKAGAFCVNVLGADQAGLCRSFAVSGGDKFAGVDWHPGVLGAPVLEGSLATIECALVEIHDAGDHEIVTGAVVSLATGAGEPLLFWRGAFGQFAPHDAG